MVKDQANNEVHFKVKTKTRLEKVRVCPVLEVALPRPRAEGHATLPHVLQVIVAYCNKKGMDTSAVRFLFDGSRVNPSATPGVFGVVEGSSVGRGMPMSCFMSDWGHAVPYYTARVAEETLSGYARAPCAKKTWGYPLECHSFTRDNPRCCHTEHSWRLRCLGLVPCAPIRGCPYNRLSGLCS